MSTSKHTTLWCDFVGPHESDHPSNPYEDEERCVNWTDHGMARDADTRAHARDEGWVHRAGKDYCPRHA